MRERWLEVVGKSFPDGHAPGFSGYPLLGDERQEPARVEGSRWALRLALREVFDPAAFAALLEDVQELHWCGEAGVDLPTPPGCEVYSRESSGSGWELLSQDAAERGQLGVLRRSWRKGPQTVTEECVSLDGQVLRNLALLRSFRETLSGVDRWVVRSSVSAGGETEGLINDTLAYWTGAVGGVDVLEVEQQPGEDFETLWARLSICRLLRWEADLARPGDVGAGAGIFSDLGLSFL